MKRIFYLLKQSLFIKLALVTALVVGGGSTAWGEDYVETLLFESSIPSGWLNGGQYGISSSYSAFSVNSDNIATANNYGQFALTSQRTDLTINRGQKIVIRAKVNGTYNSTAQHVTIKYAREPIDNKKEYSVLKKFTNSDYSSKDEYVDLEYVVESDNLKDGSRLQIQSQATTICRIEILAAIQNLSSIDEDMAPGVFQSAISSSLNIKYTAAKGWNTICMPIQLRTWSVNYLNQLFGNDWNAYSLFSYSEGMITFAKIAASGYVQANTPLLVYAPNASGTQSQLQLSDVSVIYSDSPKAVAGTATFQGTYAPKTYQDGDNWYGVTSSGQVLQAGEGAYVKGYRAYFTGIQPPANDARVSIVLEGDGTTTDLGFVKMMDKDAKDVYTLSGQKVQKGGKGLYIVNGRKVVIK